MKTLHIVIPDLFLPPQVAAHAVMDLALPALQKMLARGQSQSCREDSLEDWLGRAFGVQDGAVAAVTARADGLETGEFYWLRADPVHLRLQRDQMVLQALLNVAADEANALCASLNAQFADDGVQFFAPHPQRWYVRLPVVPQMHTQPLAAVIGSDVQRSLPQGADALRWHQIFNEIQMLFFEHPVNQAREERGALAMNSVWFWGGGVAMPNLLQPCDLVCGESELAMALAQVAGVKSAPWSLAAMPAEGATLLVWDGLQRAIQAGDLDEWRSVLMQFERECALPVLAAMRTGDVQSVRLDVLRENAAQSFVLQRSDIWKVWRRTRTLLHYSAS